MVDETQTSDESFGFISASRVSGKARLFNSAVSHQHFVEVTIGRAEAYRRFQSEGFYGREELIQIAMSEAQFAQFITSMNVGSGAPCTLRSVGGKSIAPPPEGTNTKQVFDAEAKAQVAAISADLIAAMGQLSALKDKGKAGKNELADVLSAFETVQRELTANLPYMLKTMAGALEKMTEQAKSDLNAHSVLLHQKTLETGGPVPEIAADKGPFDLDPDWDRAP